MQRFLGLLLLCLGINLQAQDATTFMNIPYYTEGLMEEDAYLKERCVLDIYIPEDSIGFSTIIWFHGGGLTAGNKYIPEALMNKGVAVVAVNYRLSPRVNTKISTLSLLLDYHISNFPTRLETLWWVSTH